LKTVNCRVIADKEQKEFAVRSSENDTDIFQYFKLLLFNTAIKT